MYLLNQIKTNTAPGPEYEIDNSALAADFTPIVRLIAYYLPQFHPILENDKWWGKGFTEWTNVTKAVPRFVGHYQPRLPGELGFYDLRNKDIIRRQAVIARDYGLSGFCFHYYWFGGKRLLETPLTLLLNNPDIDISFCVNWANENWTRRWDGLEREVLIAQKHSPEDDIAFAKSIEPLFRDPRYIRINGRPLLMLYKPSLLPDATDTVARWRKHFTSVGIGDPYIIMPQMDEDYDPRAYGMDAAAGFPPHKVGWREPRIPAESVELFDPDFKGNIVDYETLAASALANNPNLFKLFPGVCPSWDNEARVPGKGFCFHGSTPEKYGRWLAGACERALEAETPDERIVFINAWNEWAEGTYLEPDRHFGYAYLVETSRILRRLRMPKRSAAKQYQAISPGRLTLQRKGPTLSYRTKRMIKRIANKLADGAEAISRVMRL